MTHPLSYHSLATGGGQLWWNMTHPDSNEEVHDVADVEKGAFDQEDQQPHHKVPHPPDGGKPPKEEHPAPQLKVLDISLRYMANESSET